MSRIVRSARGELVDLDLVTIKQQIASAVQPTLVKERGEYIENRLKRRARTMAENTQVDIQPTLNLNSEPEQDIIDPVIEETTTIKQKARK